MKSATGPQCPDVSMPHSSLPSQTGSNLKMRLLEQRISGKNGVTDNNFPQRTFEKNLLTDDLENDTISRNNNNNNNNNIGNEEFHKDEAKTNLSISAESGISLSNHISSSNQTLLTSHLCQRSRDRGISGGNATTNSSTGSGSRGSYNHTSTLHPSSSGATIIAETPPLSTTIYSNQHPSSANSQSANGSTMSNASQSHNQGKSSASKQLKLAHLQENTPSSGSNVVRGLLGRSNMSASSQRKKTANPTKDKKHSIREVVNASPNTASRKRPRSQANSDRHTEKHTINSHSPTQDDNAYTVVIASEPQSTSRDRTFSRGGSGSNLSHPISTPPAISSAHPVVAKSAIQKQKKDRESQGNTKTMFDFFGSPSTKNLVPTISNTNKTIASGTTPVNCRRNTQRDTASSVVSTNQNQLNSHSNFPLSKSNTNSLNLGSDSSQIERLKIEIAELRKKCQHQQDEINSIRNNTTIETISLKGKLQQRDQEVKQTQLDLEQLKKSKEKAIQIIEKLILDQNLREAKEKRQKLASDGTKLGRFVYARAGLHSVENWEHGFAKKTIEKKRLELRRKKEDLELRHKYTIREYNTRRAKVMQQVQKSSNSVSSLESFDSNANPPITDTNALPSLELNLEVMEAEESYQMQLAHLNEQILQLDEEEKVLHIEKMAHVRELRRIESEDTSRFKNKPKLNNRYLLLSLLGKGGFSEVWRAYDLLGLREVAVKIHQLDSRWSESKKDNYTKHVSREYEIHRDVRHPRIVSLFDVFEIDNDSFATVLECCKGSDLDTLLKEKKMLPERTARAILLQILSGMQYLSSPSENGNRQGIIHYDLKPANILFDEHGFAKITDFGLSKIVDATDPADSMELTSQGAGTYWYLPPECFVTHQAVRISNKVDVWSIGVIFYQMLFGRRPFGDGQSQEKVLMNHTMLNAKEVKFPEHPKVSKGCKEFLRCCLMHDQVYRPSISQLCQNPYLVRKDLSTELKESNIHHLDKMQSTQAS